MFGTILVFLGGISLVLFVTGLLTQAWKLLFWSGAAMIPPMLAIYLGGSNLWFQLCIAVPLLIFASAFIMKHRNTIKL